MANWIERRISSFAFFLQKAYWKMVTTKPSMFVIAALTVAASIFLLGGGIYDLLEKPLLAIIGTERIIVYYPFALNEQFLVESIIIMTAYAIGVVGLILAYQSTKYVYRPRQAYIFLLVGCILIIISYIFTETSLLARWA